MPAMAENLFGEQALIRWDDGVVLHSLNGGVEQAVLSLPQESGLALRGLPDGRWVIVTQDAEDNVQRIYSVDGVFYA